MKRYVAGLLDIVLLLIFVAVGRKVHGHRQTISGFASTAAPFLSGLVIGWLLARGWKRPVELFPTAVVVWISTVVIGQVLRLIVGQGSAMPFVLVSLGYFALTLIGWRLVFDLFNRRSSHSI